MPENPPALPDISCLLELDRILLDALTKHESLYESVRAGIVRMGDEVIQTLGIPGRLALEVVALDEQTLLNNQFLRLTVQDILCDYPEELLRRVHSYVNLIPLQSKVTPDDVLHWLRKLATSQVASEDKPDTLDDVQKDEKVTEFFGLLCLELIKQRPSVLLGPTQAKIYCTLLSRHIEELDPAPASWPPDPQWLQAILGDILDLGISLANTLEIAKVLSQPQECSQDEISEKVIDALRSDIEIHVPLEYLRWLTTVDEDGPGGFAAVRSILFQRQGLRCPTSHFVQNERLKPHCFTLKIQHLTTLPWVDPSSELAYFLDYALNTLREYGCRLIHRTFVQEQLEQLNQYCPILVKTIHAKVSDEQLTHMLRALVAEGVSIRDLRLILERYLDYTYVNYEQDLTHFIRDLRLILERYLDYTYVNYEQNLAHFNRELELDPNNADTYLGRGYTYLRLKKTEQAVSDFVRSGEADPKNVNAAWMVVYAAMDRQRPGIEVAEHLEVIAAIDPSQTESHICEGVALALKGKFKEGLVELEQSILLNPQTQDSHFWKGMIYAHMGRNQEAIKSVQKALEQGLPPILLKPLYWLEKDNPGFYEKSVVPLLARFNL